MTDIMVASSNFLFLIIIILVNLKFIKSNLKAKGSIINYVESDDFEFPTFELTSPKTGETLVRTFNYSTPFQRKEHDILCVVYNTRKKEKFVPVYITLLKCKFVFVFTVVSVYLAFIAKDEPEIIVLLLFFTIVLTLLDLRKLFIK